MTETETKPKEKLAKESALARPPSKFEPDPEAYMAKAKKEEAKPESPTGQAEAQEPAPPAQSQQQAAPAPKPVQPEPDEGSFLDIGAGYKMRNRSGSAHSVVTRIVAQQGRFPEVVAILKGEFDPTDKTQAHNLLGKMFVLRDSVEDMTKDDAEFKAHAAKRMGRLKARADKGDAKAKAVIEKAARIKDGKWVGDVREIISTCCGSYRTDNKNIRKFKDAGLVFRQYPEEPGKNDKVYVMLYPSKYNSKVNKAIATTFKAKE